jgi:hypothetical protein
MRFFRGLAALGFIITLTSCLSVDTEIFLNSDGSGTAKMVYSVSTLALDISDVDKKKNVIFFPILKDDFDSAASNINGLQILSYEIKDDGNRYYINSEISFDTLQSLSSFTGLPMTLVEQGNNKLLSVTVYEVLQNSEINEQARSLIDNSFPDESFSFSLNIPGDIIRVTGATFSGSDVLFQISLKEIIQSKNTIKFSVEYR